MSNRCKILQRCVKRGPVCKKHLRIIHYRTARDAFITILIRKRKDREGSLFLRIGRCVFDDLLQLLLEFHPGHQHAGTTAQAFDADVRPHADDAPLLGFMTGMLLLHFDNIVEIVSVVTSMLSASFMFLRMPPGYCSAAWRSSSARLRRVPVRAPARTFFTSSKSTSPHSFPFSSRLMPTSMTTAPSLIQSALTRRGTPTAAMTISASRHSALRSAVRE